MTELLPFLSQLISVPGLSGYESPVRDLIEQAWRPLTDEIHLSRLGSLHALRRGTGPAPRPSLLITAHMDAIGLMVTGIVDEFLRLTEIGGLDLRVLPGQPVTVHGQRDLPGVVVLPPADLLPDRARDEPCSLDYLLVDVGLLPHEVERWVRVGDLVSFAQPPLQLGDEYLAGHSLDNRACVAALTICLQELHARLVEWDVWAAATVQEEETLGGALTSSFQIRPSLAVVLDVTFGEGPGAPSHLAYPLGKGPTLGWGPNIHPGLFNSFKALAERFEIPYQPELIPANSGTEAVAIQTVAEGIPTMLVGIPLRYMHTPVEVIALKDLERTGRLLAEFAASLDGAYLDQLGWED